MKKIRWMVLIVLLFCGFFCMFLLTSCDGLEFLRASYTNDVGMRFRMVLAPARFRMGSPTSECVSNFRIGEVQHAVTLTEGYYVQTTEVTQGQWKAVMETTTTPSYHEGCDECPVENITWYEAVEFCNLVSDLDGYTRAYSIDGTNVTWDRFANGYRLPTEAEWEYAARAGTDTAYPLGDVTIEPVDYRSCSHEEENLSSIAWYSCNSGVVTHPVARKDPLGSGFLLYDMHGNVREWCWDWYGPYEFEDQWTDVVDPAGPADGSTKVNRGGSMTDFSIACRSAKRYLTSPDLTSYMAGFRMVRFANPG